jgi:hypothetical protein
VRNTAACTTSHTTTPPLILTVVYLIFVEYKL